MGSRLKLAISYISPDVSDLMVEDGVDCDGYASEFSDGVAISVHNWTLSDRANY